MTTADQLVIDIDDVEPNWLEVVGKYNFYTIFN